MRPVNLVWFLALLLPGIGHATLIECHLPDASMQEPSALPSPKREALERAYRDYFDTLLTLAEKNNLAGLEKCCATSTQSLATRSVCSLLSYVGGKKENPKRFLLDTPQEKDDVEWLWRWDTILLRQPSQKITAEFPSGIAAFYIDQVYLLIDTEPSLALDRLLKIDRYADGEYGQYISEKLLTLFKGRPQLVISHWPQIRSFRSSVNRMVELYPDEMPRLRKTFGKVCTTAKPGTSCAEILQVLKP